MNVSAILLVAALLSVDVGWRPAEGGGTEYIIQIEPHLVGSLGGGVTIVSDVPPPLRSTRTLRIRIGNGELPRKMPDSRSNSSRVTAEKAIATDPPPGTSVGWQPLEDDGLEYLIQMEPRVISELNDGEEIVFDIRGAPAGVSSFRVIVGTDSLPRITPPQADHAPVTSDDPAVLESRTAAVSPPATESRGAADTASTDDLQGAEDAPPVDASQQSDTAAQASDPPSSPDEAAPDASPEPAESSSNDQTPVVSASPETTADPPTGPELGNPSAAVAQTPEDAGESSDAADASPPSLDSDSASLPEDTPQAAADPPDTSPTQDTEPESPKPDGADQIPALSATDNVPLSTEHDQAPESKTDDPAPADAVADSDGEESKTREVLRPPSDAPGDFTSDRPARPRAATDDSKDQDNGRLLAAAATPGSGPSGAAMSGQGGSGDSSSVSAASPTPSAKPSEGSDGTVPTEAIPRWGWWAAVSGLFASLGANIYIFWLFLGLRRRYFELLDTPAASSPA